MKKCPYCAEEIQDEAIVCRFCGRDLAKSPHIDQPVQHIQTKMPKPKKPRVNRLLMIVGIFLFFCVLCGGFNSLSAAGKDKAKPTETAKASSSVVINTFTPAAIPTKTPAPTRTPAPTADTYFLDMQQKFLDYNDAFQQVNKYIQMVGDDTTLVLDNDWKTKTGLALGMLNFRADEMTKLQPTAKFEKFHSYIIDLVKETYLFTDSYAKGIDNLDKDSILAANVHMQNMSAISKAAALELDNLNSDP